MSKTLCKNCNQIGHGIKSTICPVNIQENQRLKHAIQSHILSLDCLSYELEEQLEYLSTTLGITSNKCKTLYDEIPPETFLEMRMDIPTFISSLEETSRHCHDCKKVIYQSQTNTMRIWKEHTLCDTCWDSYESEREELWEFTYTLKPIQCVICDTPKTIKSERFHYDHLDMFEKKSSVCSMVYEGASKEEIQTEIEKCQILCFACHHIITKCERKFPFIRLKQSLTRRLNAGEITQEEYDTEKETLSHHYKLKMAEIYKQLRLHFLKVS